MLLFGIALLILNVWSSSTYRAGIVQIEKECDVFTFLPYIDKAKKAGVEILVFPELALSQFRSSYFEFIEVGSNPCENYTFANNIIQSNMSCRVRENGIYVVFDMVERGDECKQGTPYCDYGFYIYNTAVVMDRTGTIIGKYRKHNPIVQQIKPGDPVLYHFTTDFGVTFGMFICFDIIFKMPSEDIVREKKINNILFPTYWVDSMFVDGGPMQQAYSEYFQVNFIAPNTIAISEGSGIYSRGKPIQTTFARENEFIFADVPIFDFIDPPPINHQKLLPRTPETDTKVIQFKSGDEGSFTSQVSSHSCEVKYKVKKGSSESFQVGAVRIQDTRIFTDSCIVANCGKGSTEIDKCTSEDPKTTFEFLQVTMTMNEGIRLAYPLVATKSKKILSDFDKMRFSHSNDTHSVTIDGSDEPILFAVQFGVF